MDERVFARLCERLRTEANTDVVLASVLRTDGATPRKLGSRMLLTADQSDFSVGGGQLEARVCAAARDLLAEDRTYGQLQVALNGADGSAGICGGRMRIGLRRWRASDRTKLETILSALQAGEQPVLSGADQGGESADDCRLLPNPRLLIVGAGHCGLALYQAAQSLDFDLWVQDSRAELLLLHQYPLAQRLVGGAELLALAAQSQRPLYAVLLNRDYAADVAALTQLLPLRPVFVGMMGSRRRIALVLADPALQAHPDQLPAIHAPVGLNIDAHTPAEIAISILAQLIAHRAKAGSASKPI